ncbi:LysM peptidoglycan-binding domain-containing protein [Bacteroidota bacterium]
MAQVNRSIFLLIIILFFSTGVLDAQEGVPVQRSENKVVLEGKFYYVHVVKRGQTLYSIAKAYNISVKEIIIENPGVSSELIIGQVLKIPTQPGIAVDVDTQKKPEVDNAHILKPGETIYSVSRMYNCSVEEILKVNPNIDIYDLSVGMEIILPDREESELLINYDEEGFVYHKVKKGESLRSISRYYRVNINSIRNSNPELGWGSPHGGDILRIPRPESDVASVFKLDSIYPEEQIKEEPVPEREEYTYEELRQRMAEPSKMYRIAYLIPFNYEASVPLDTLLKDVKSPMARDRIKEDYMLKSSIPGSVNFLEFLEGSLLAIDSLSNAGMSLDVHVYDTRKSMYETRQILEKPEMEQMDLIIGPFYSYNLELVADFGNRHGIPVVTPFHSNDSILIENPYLFQPMPSLKVEYDHNVPFIGRAYKGNLIFVHDGDSMGTLNVDYYREDIFRELRKYSDTESILFKEVILPARNSDGLVHALTPDCNNLVVIPAIDEAFASRVASALYYELENFDISLFGSSYWFGFDDIEISYIHALGLTVSHNYWYRYSDPDYSRFLLKYRQNYYKEPGHFTTRGINYGAIGYDLSLYFLSAMYEYGSRFIINIENFENDRTIGSYHFNRITPYGGYTNTSFHYYHFADDLEVMISELPEIKPFDKYLKPATDDPFYYDWAEPQPDTTGVNK